MVIAGDDDGAIVIKEHCPCVSLSSELYYYHKLIEFVALDRSSRERSCGLIYKWCTT